MSLGPNNETCKSELIEAMRARLKAEDPELEANVEREDVKKNLGALGLAIYRIATVRAETIANLSTDPDFWEWIAGVSAWLLELKSWQQGVVEAFANWTPTLPAEQDLKTALLAVPSPGVPPEQVPTALKGKIE
jgi:hypothetical protein